jgi:hypothetical protein
MSHGLLAEREPVLSGGGDQHSCRRKGYTSGPLMRELRRTKSFELICRGMAELNTGAAGTGSSL